MRSKRFARLALVAALSAVAPVATPGAGPAPAWAQESGAAPVAAPAQPSPTSSGLPRRRPDPRTLEEYWPVFAGFALSWAAIVAYLVSLGGSFSRTARAVQQLEQRRAGGSVR